MPKGTILGACAAWPGGFAESMVAHGSQVFRVPDSIADEVAVLTEPLAVSVHAVLRHLPQPGDEVLVIGGGPIAFGVLWALRELAPDAKVVLFTVEDYQLAIAIALGAHEAWSPRRALTASGATSERGALPRARGERDVVGPPASDARTAVPRRGLRARLRLRRLSGEPRRRAPRDRARRLARPRRRGRHRAAARLNVVWHKELRIEGTAYYAVRGLARRARPHVRRDARAHERDARAARVARDAPVPARGVRARDRRERGAREEQEREGRLRTKRVRPRPRPRLRPRRYAAAALLRSTRAISPLVTARCKSVGARPGASALGVTSLDGNICTNAGARRTRSTIVRSRIIDVY